MNEGFYGQTFSQMGKLSDSMTHPSSVCTGQVGLPNVRAYTAVIRSQGGLKLQKIGRLFLLGYFLALNNPLEFSLYFYILLLLQVSTHSIHIQHLYMIYIYNMILYTIFTYILELQLSFLPFQVDNGNWLCRC